MAIDTKALIDLGAQITNEYRQAHQYNPSGKAQTETAQTVAQTPTSTPVSGSVPISDVFTANTGRQSAVGSSSDAVPVTGGVVTTPVITTAKPSWESLSGYGKTKETAQAIGAEALAGATKKVQTVTNPYSLATFVTGLESSARKNAAESRQRYLEGAAEAGVTNSSRAKATSEAIKEKERSDLNAIGKRTDFYEGKFDEVNSKSSGLRGVVNAAANASSKLADKQMSDLGGSVAPFLAQLGYSAGSLIPDIIAGRVAGVAAGLMGASTTTAANVASAAGLGNMFTGVYGDTYSELRGQNIDSDVAAKTAFSRAAVEVATELLGGGMPFLNEGVFGTALNKGADFLAHSVDREIAEAAIKGMTKSPEVASTVAKAAAGLGKFLVTNPVGEMIMEGFGEAVEEATSEFFNPIFDKFTGYSDRVEWASAGDIGQAALGGLIMGGVFSVGETTLKKVASGELKIRTRSNASGKAETYATVTKNGVDTEVYQDGSVVYKDSETGETLTKEQADAKKKAVREAAQRGGVQTDAQSNQTEASTQRTVAESNGRQMSMGETGANTESQEAEGRTSAQGVVATPDPQTMRWVIAQLNSTIFDGAKIVKELSDFGLNIDESIIKRDLFFDVPELVYTDGMTLDDVQTWLDSASKSLSRVDMRAEVRAGKNTVDDFIRQRPIAISITANMVSDEAVSNYAVRHNMDAANDADAIKEEIAKQFNALSDEQKRASWADTIDGFSVYEEIDKADFEKYYGNSELPTRFLGLKRADTYNKINKQLKYYQKALKPFGIKVTLMSAKQMRENRGATAAWDYKKGAIVFNPYQIGSTYSMGVSIAHELVHMAQFVGQGEDLHQNIQSLAESVGLDYDAMQAIVERTYNAKDSAAYGGFDWLAAETDARILGYFLSSDSIVQRLGEIDVESLTGLKNFVEELTANDESLSPQHAEILARLSFALHEFKGRKDKAKASKPAKPAKIKNATTITTDTPNAAKAEVEAPVQESPEAEAEAPVQETAKTSESEVAEVKATSTENRRDESPASVFTPKTKTAEKASTVAKQIATEVKDSKVKEAVATQPVQQNRKSKNEKPASAKNSSNREATEIFSEKGDKKADENLKVAETPASVFTAKNENQARAKAEKQTRKAQPKASQTQREEATPQSSTDVKNGKGYEKEFKGANTPVPFLPIRGSQIYKRDGRLIVTAWNSFSDPELDILKSLGFERTLIEGDYRYAQAMGTAKAKSIENAVKTGNWDGLGVERIYTAEKSVFEQSQDATPKAFLPIENAKIRQVGNKLVVTGAQVNPTNRGILESLGFSRQMVDGTMGYAMAADSTEAAGIKNAVESGDWSEYGITKLYPPADITNYEYKGEADDARVGDDEDLTFEEEVNSYEHFFGMDYEKNPSEWGNYYLDNRTAARWFIITDGSDANDAKPKTKKKKSTNKGKFLGNRPIDFPFIPGAKIVYKQVYDRLADQLTYEESVDRKTGQKAYEKSYAPEQGQTIGKYFITFTEKLTPENKELLKNMGFKIDPMDGRFGYSIEAAEANAIGLRYAVENNDWTAFTFGERQEVQTYPVTGAIAGMVSYVPAMDEIRFTPTTVNQLVRDNLTDIGLSYDSILKQWVATYSETIANQLGMPSEAYTNAQANTVQAESMPVDQSKHSRFESTLSTAQAPYETKATQSKGIAEGYKERIMALLNKLGKSGSKVGVWTEAALNTIDDALKSSATVSRDYYNGNPYGGTIKVRIPKGDYAIVRYFKGLGFTVAEYGENEMLFTCPYNDLASAAVGETTFEEMSPEDQKSLVYIRSRAEAAYRKAQSDYSHAIVHDNLNSTVPSVDDSVKAETKATEENVANPMPDTASDTVSKESALLYYITDNADAGAQKESGRAGQGYYFSKDIESSNASGGIAYELYPDSILDGDNGKMGDLDPEIILEAINMSARRHKKGKAVDSILTALFGNNTLEGTEELNTLNTIREISTVLLPSNPDVMSSEILMLMGYDAVDFEDSTAILDERKFSRVGDSDGLAGFAREESDVDRRYRELGEEFGTMEDSTVPRKASSSTRTNQSVAKFMADDRLTDVSAEKVKENVVAGLFDFIPKSDDVTMDAAHRWIRKFITTDAQGNEHLRLDDVFTSVMNVAVDGSINPKELPQFIAKLELLNTELVNAIQNGSDPAKYGAMLEKLQVEYSLISNATGTALHNFKLLKQMTPEGRIYRLNRSLESLLDELRRRSKSKIKGLSRNAYKLADLEAYKIPEELKQAMYEASDAKTQDFIEDVIIRQIAGKVPPTIESRLTAYRYLCMLGNVRTHMRNMISNGVMGMERSMSRTLAGRIEDRYARKGKLNGAERLNTAVKATPEVLDFVARDVEVLTPTLQNGGKMGFQSKIKQYTKNFGNSKFGQFVETLAKENGDLLEKEDLFSLKKTYKSALAKYIMANGINIQDFENAVDENGKVRDKQALEDLAKAREYAVAQAWEATYRSANLVANKLNELEKAEGMGGLAARVVIEGLIPFKRTPMNILKTGLQYSPAGLVTGAIKLYRATQGIGTTTVPEAISHLCDGLTGTGIAAVGLLFGSLGILKAGGSDNDREKYYDEMLGNQPYSITVWGKNITLDWLTPSSMPLFMGAALGNMQKEATEDGDEDTSLKFENFLTALTTLADPVTNLSMLQSINDAFNNYNQNKLGGLIEGAVESFALQFVPTISGQAIRTFDPTRTTTYASKDADGFFGQRGERFINKLRNKSITARLFLGSNEPYVDQWGRTEERDGGLIEAYHQFIAPYYAKDVEKTYVDDRLTDIFTESGNRSVLPRTPNSYITIDKKTIYLDAADYTTFKTTTGQLSYQGVDTALTSDLFDSLSTDGKAKVISNIYDYAREVAKNNYANSNSLEYEESKDVERVAEAQRLGLSIGEYFIIKYNMSQLNKKAEQRRYAGEIGLNLAQRAVFGL